MSGKCLLDTNIVIALFADETAVKENLAKIEEVFVPSVVIGELFYGAQWLVEGAVYTAKARAAWLSGQWQALCQKRAALPIVA